MQILRATYLSIAAVALMGCSVGEEVARDKARDAIDPIVAKQFPGVPVKPVTDCVIDNASLQELLAVTAAASTGNQVKAAEIVVEVASRPDTVKCIAVKGLPALLQGLA
ncbi:hypothetical protein F9L33_00285 [Amylibacter sp. SFDW26]|uniref:hypothetical protein n=1 Tax=Amylibacter sp. SFDW26 TaxID=2652722 RepID=UPI0012628310|nr:hypothetical protein [Amylibacter sp. SFDW26]KAB7615243.1 hypothetical protein F9L33_00285 [Amylibacter sp. SFDW26]